MSKDECEACGTEIAKGDRYAVMLGGEMLCEKDAPSFQDCLDHYANNPPSTDDERGAFETCKRDLASHIAKGGSADDKPLWVMT